jgi:SAM-dependent methyltransferase
VDERRREVQDKYDRGASTYSSRYADPDAQSDFYLQRIERWAVPVEPASSVLEISCADGFMTEALVRRGFEVTGIDLSPEMVRVATERLSSAGLDADLRVADANTLEPDRTWDVLLAPMATFYHYIDDPAALLARLAPAITRKVLVDLNPRELDPERALRDLRAAGFTARTEWEPVYVPSSARIGAAGRWALRTVGSIPPVRSAILRRKFNVVAMGAKTSPGSNA